MPRATAHLIVALDVPGLRQARRWVERLSTHVSFFKIGSQFFTAAGPDGVRALVRAGARVFLDLKFHDIPNTAAQAAVAAASLGVEMLTVHASGGIEMMSAVRGALRRHCGERARPRVVAVTLLTSLDRADLRRLGWRGAPQTNVVRLARLAQKAGMDGVVAAPGEIRAIRRACGERFLIVTPGIRPAGSKPGDQARADAPAAAVCAAADYLVVGRPILTARDPLCTVREILAEMRLAARAR